MERESDKRRRAPFYKRGWIEARVIATIFQLLCRSPLPPSLLVRAIKEHHTLITSGVA
jgi:uncharacterized protein VirK/YbjX